MMVSRRKDIADFDQILRDRGDQLDRDWVYQQLIELYGRQDPRITEWLELTREIS